LQATDVEAVDPDQLARAGGLERPLGLPLPRRLIGGGVAGDKREPLLPRVEAVAAQAAPDAVVRDDDPAPALSK